LNTSISIKIIKTFDSLIRNNNNNNNNGFFRIRNYIMSLQTSGVLFSYLNEIHNSSIIAADDIFNPCHLLWNVSLNVLSYTHERQIDESPLNFIILHRTGMHIYLNIYVYTLPIHNR